jgi:CRISPR/Cas system CMR subunit Cmr6 (Cas7 group RAMP superfamily)
MDMDTDPKVGGEMDTSIRYLVVGAGVTFATYDNFEDAESLRVKLDEKLICTVSVVEEHNNE